MKRIIYILLGLSLLSTNLLALELKSGDPLELELALSDAWTFQVVKNKPGEKKTIYFPRGKSIRFTPVEIIEQRIKRPARFRILNFITHLSNSPIESDCRPIEAGEANYHFLRADAQTHIRRFLGMRCRREQKIRLIHVIDAGPDIYILTFLAKQNNWADLQFKTMHYFLMNRTYLCHSSKSVACHAEIQRKIRAFVEYDRANEDQSQIRKTSRSMGRNSTHFRWRAS